MKQALLTVLAAAAALTLVAAPAPARVIVVDRAGHVLHRVAISDDGGYPTLVGWDANGLLFTAVGEESHIALFAIDPRTSIQRPIGPRDDMVSIGPGGRWVTVGYEPRTNMYVFVVRAADGRPLATLHEHGIYAIEDTIYVAWSADGGHVAIGHDEQAQVVDTVSGVRTGSVRLFNLGPQALSPDGDTLLDAIDLGLNRIDVATGARQAIATSTPDKPVRSGAWSPAGRLAVLYDDRLTFPQSADPPIAVPSGDRAVWSPDGTALAVVTWSCAEDVVRLVVPGGGRPTALAHGSFQGLAWSPDGARLALDLGPPHGGVVEPKRGRRHAWPKRVRKTYNMPSRRGDRAVHAALVRFAVALRHGTRQQHALNPLRARLEAISKHSWGEAVVSDRVLTATAQEASRWLHAAGYKPIDGLAGDLDRAC